METTDILSRSLLSEQVADHLTTSIMNGEYGIGEKLPTESSLSTRYNVSRTVIREAMKLLKQKGLVESRVAKGTFVIANLDKGIGESIDLILQNLSGSGQDELLELRRSIEPEFAALAAVKASDEDLENLRALIAEMENCLQNHDRFSELDMKFHMAILAATKNNLMISVMMPIFEKIHQQQYEHIRIQSDGMYKSHAQHKTIYTALKARDPEQARSLVKKHINSVENDFATLKSGRNLRADK